MPWRSPCPSLSCYAACGRPLRISARRSRSAPGCEQPQIVREPLGSDLAERVADPLDAIAVDKHDTRCVVEVVELRLDAVAAPHLSQLVGRAEHEPQPPGHPLLGEE